MKKIMFLIMAVAPFVSCQKLPSDVDRDNEYIVFTSMDTGKDFSSYDTFTVADSILVMESPYNVTKVRNSSVDGIVNSFISAMKDMGYAYVTPDKKSEADLGIQISYLSDTDYIVDNVDPYGWLDYPGYWSPYYWGYWGGWYRPYPVTYQYTTHSVIADMVDLKADSGDGENLPVLWTSMMSGDSYNSRIDEMRFREAVRQAFAQSSGLRKTNE